MVYLLLTALAAQSAPTPPPFLAMVLRVEGDVELRPLRGQSRPTEELDLLFPGDVLVTKNNAEAVIVFRSDGRRERIRPQREATLTEQGFTPPAAVEALAVAGQERNAVLDGLREISPASRGAVAVLRDAQRARSQVFSPVNGARVLSDRPGFSWRPDPRASSYRLEITSAASGRPVWSEFTSEALLAYPSGSGSLRRGRGYAWRVIARTDKGDQSWAAGEFYVLSSAKVAALQGLESLTRGADSADLALAATVYEAEEVFDVAIRLYERLAGKNPAKKSFQLALVRLYARAGREEEFLKARERLDRMQANH